MQIEIVRPDGDLKCEVWDFWLYIAFEDGNIYLDNYQFQTRESSRRKKWTTQTRWSRLEPRVSTVAKPTVPPDVADEVKTRLAAWVSTLRIK